MILNAMLVLIVIIVALFTFTYVRYRSDIRAAYERVQSLGSEVIETAHGPIEYTTLGDGYPVLVVHGIFGGFDQGLLTARDYSGEGFRAIIPSRFGYLRTPLPTNALPADQADAFASLLDSLGIDKASIVATSAGGTSAIQFVLRHPERASSLVLISSNAPSETEAALPPKWVASIVFRSDYVFWLMTTYFRSSLKGIMGVPKGFKLTPEYEAQVAEMMETILPVNPRSDGALHDMFVSNPDINTGYPLHEIAVPVLIVNAVDDPLAHYDNAASMAKRIPGAKLVTIESGGHLLLGHSDEVKTEIIAFLNQCSQKELQK